VNDYHSIPSLHYLLLLSCVWINTNRDNHTHKIISILPATEILIPSSSYLFIIEFPIHPFLLYFSQNHRCSSNLYSLCLNKYIHSFSLSPVNVLPTISTHFPPSLVIISLNCNYNYSLLSSTLYIDAFDLLFIPRICSNHTLFQVCPYVLPCNMLLLNL